MISGLPLTAQQRIYLAKASRRSGRDNAVYKLDLITAVWQWSRLAVMNVTGLTDPELCAIRNHERPPSDDLIKVAGDLEALHYWIWAIPMWSTKPADFWRRTITFPDPIGDRAPLDLVEEGGRDAIEPIINFVKQWSTI